MAKYTLTAEVDFDEIILIGISCHQKIYKLCWALNKTLGFSLRKGDDYSFQKGNKQHLFLRYKFVQPKTDISYTIIENRGVENTLEKDSLEKSASKRSMLLFPDIKNIDYLMIIQGVLPESDIKALTHELKNVNFILAAFGIQLEDYKSKTNFINFL